MLAQSKADPQGALLKVDPRLYIASFTMTDYPLFIRDAAVVYAVDGKLAAACELMEKKAPDPGANPDERLFRATLCYDTGMFDRVFEYLPVYEKDGDSQEALALMGDTAWSQKNSVLSNSLWESSVIHYPDTSPIPYYNLAATANDTIDEKHLLEACLSRFSSYYPAVVRYVRSVPDAVERTERDPVEEMLEKAGFQTLEMEEKASRQPVGLKDARRVLAQAVAGTGTGAASSDAATEGAADAAAASAKVSSAKVSSATAASADAVSDIRFLIEDLRLTSREKPDIARTTAAIWILLEKYPDDPVLRLYACWYFLSIKDFATSFKLNKGSTEGEGIFYSALEAASLGDLVKAEDLFSTIANDDRNAWRALADIARIKEKTGDYQGAIDSYSMAAQLDPDTRSASVLHFEEARLLESSHYTDKAIAVLRYAVSLDPANYRASARLRELESAR
jgi:tetratricopeptide (TPR) repeat protein